MFVNIQDFSKECVTKCNFLISQPYVVGSQKNRLNETVL